MSGWLISSITIEGLRGINNEGDPLVLDLAVDAVNSIFAPNAVGKSSVFDSLLFAIRGCIKKLDNLPAAEKGKDYYRNQFHSTGQGFVELGLISTDGLTCATVRVSLDAQGKRVVTSPDHSDPNALLASLNREFALLDYAAFQKFITDTPTDRGRSFAGLLGLDSYSQSRQFLRGIDDTRAFRNHFQAADLDNQIRGKEQTIGSNTVLAHKTAASALGKKPEDFTDTGHIVQEIQAQLVSSPAIGQQCAGKKLSEIDFDKCIDTILEAEGGEKKKAYTILVTEEGDLQKLQTELPDSTLLSQLATAAQLWEDALALTSGADRLAVFKAAEKVLASSGWPMKEQCPACDEVAQKNVLDFVRAQLKLFENAEVAGKELSDLIVALKLHEKSSLEERFIQAGELSTSARIQRSGARYAVSSARAGEIQSWQKTLEARLAARITKVADEKSALEKDLPTSLVAITNLVGDSKLITNAIATIDQAVVEKKALDARAAKLKRLKAFLTSASDAFGTAEGEATDRRLKKVQPKAKEIFTAIMADSIIADVKKSGTDEGLSLYLEKFFNKTGLSALALLYESYRNALSISLYLAAASLYGAPLNSSCLMTLLPASMEAISII